MGSNNPPEEFTVLVTGFGPFKSDYPLNPSWEVAKKLPEYLPPAAKSAHGRSVQKMPPVRIVVHPEPIRVNYQVVRGLVPKLWGSRGGNSADDGAEPPADDDSHANLEGESGESYRYHKYTPPAAPAVPHKIDVAVHIGMAGPQLQWSLEHRAHRDGYAMKDVDGEFLRDQERRLREGDKWVWHGTPPELFTDVDVHDVFERWREYVPVSQGKPWRNMPYRFRIEQSTDTECSRTMILTPAAGSGSPRTRAGSCATSSTSRAWRTCSRQASDVGWSSCMCRVPTLRRTSSYHTRSLLR
jgi:hypothetical protein